jgi:hypothetical protein
MLLRTNIQSEKLAELCSDILQNYIVPLQLLDWCRGWPGLFFKMVALTGVYHLQQNDYKACIWTLLEIFKFGKKKVFEQKQALVYCLLGQLSGLCSKEILAVNKDVLKINDGLINYDATKSLIVLRLFLACEVDITVDKFRATIKYSGLGDNREPKDLELQSEILNRTITAGNIQLEFKCDMPEMTSPCLTFTKLDFWVKKIRFRVPSTKEITITANQGLEIAVAKINCSQLYFCNSITSMESVMSTYMKKLTDSKIETLKSAETLDAQVSHAIIPNISNPCYAIIELFNHKGPNSLTASIIKTKFFMGENFQFFSLETGKQIVSTVSLENSEEIRLELTKFADRKVLMFFQ